MALPHVIRAECLSNPLTEHLNCALLGRNSGGDVILEQLQQCKGHPIAHAYYSTETCLEFRV